LKDRQQSLMAAAILSALSLPACTPDTHDAQAGSSPSPHAYGSHAGGYYGGGGSGKVERRPGQDSEDGDSDSSESDDSHGSFGEAGAAGDAGG